MRKLIVFLAMIAVVFIVICPAIAQTCSKCITTTQGTMITTAEVSAIVVARPWNAADHPRDPATGRFIKRADQPPTASALCEPLNYKKHQPVKNALRAVGKGLRAGLHFIIVGPNRI